MEVIKKKAREDYIRIWEANACLENLFRTQQRQVRVCEALRESVMYEPQLPGIKEAEKILGGADPWDLGRRRERRLPARGKHHGGRERDRLPRDAAVMRYPPSALPRAPAHGASKENARGSAGLASLCREKNENEQRGLSKAINAAPFTERCRTGKA